MGSRRFLLPALLLAATLLFAVGVIAERSAAEDHAEPAAVAGEGGHAAEEGEAEEGEPIRTAEEGSGEEHVLGSTWSRRGWSSSRFWPALR